MGEGGGERVDAAAVGGFRAGDFNAGVGAVPGVAAVVTGIERLFAVADLAWNSVSGDSFAAQFMQEGFHDNTIHGIVLGG